jgi:phosphoribosylaminoimidazole-succinocarboxamide synthase
MARKQGLILVDTKYEFGIYGDQILLIDEVHTADSSRYFFLEDYDEALKEDRSPKQLSKEFVREWLIEHDFQGLDGQIMPELPDEFRIEVYERYKELFELMTGETFTQTPVDNLDEELGILFKAY